MPTFFAVILFFLFFLHVIRIKKKRESGQKARKPLIFLAILLPAFVFKTGQKVGAKAKTGREGTMFAYKKWAGQFQKRAAAIFERSKAGRGSMAKHTADNKIKSP